MCSVPEHFGKFSEVKPEQALYKPLISYLYGDFVAIHRPKHGHSHLTVQDVSTVADAQGGRWSRPDVAAVLLTRHRFATAASIDVLSFEVKPFSKCDLTAVHEALAHVRFVNKSYLVWNRPACICSDRARYDQISANCQRYGLGLITVHDPLKYQTYELRLTPLRSDLPEADRDEFIETRFSDENRDIVLKALSRFCGGPL